jgi:biotin operon repressor
MEIIDQVLGTMKKAGISMTAGQIAEQTGIGRKDVDKAMKKLKAEGRIISPKYCYWEPAR